MQSKVIQLNVIELGLGAFGLSQAPLLRSGADGVAASPGGTTCSTPPIGRDATDADSNASDLVNFDIS